MATIGMAYKRGNWQPTGNILEIQCSRVCKLLGWSTLALKELKNDNGNIAYGVVIPLFNKTLAILIPTDTATPTFSLTASSKAPSPGQSGMRSETTQRRYLTDSSQSEPNQ